MIEYGQSVAEELKDEENGNCIVSAIWLIGYWLLSVVMDGYQWLLMVINNYSWILNDNNGYGWLLNINGCGCFFNSYG